MFPAGVFVVFHAGSLAGIDLFYKLFDDNRLLNFIQINYCVLLPVSVPVILPVVVCESGKPLSDQRS